MSTELKRSILIRLHHLSRYMRQQGNIGEGGMGSLTMHQLQAVFFVKKQQPIRMSELSGELRISPGSSSLLADRLVESGWLVRVEDPGDRRSVCLKLSNEAESKIAGIVKRRMERAGRMLDVLNSEDLHDFNRILGLLEDYFSRKS